MPRYFFHTSTDTRFTDDEGVDCATLADARRMAFRTCSELIHAAEDTFWGTRPWTVTVTDVKDIILYEIAIDGFAAPGAGALHE